MSDQPLQYVVLWHCEIVEPHFDLMFETFAGSELATWRSPVWPIEKSTVLNRLQDHRRVYLQFEGELTERRGRVERVGGGKCAVEIGEDSVWKIWISGSVDLLEIRQIKNGQWDATRKPRP